METETNVDVVVSQVISEGQEFQERNIDSEPS